MKILAMAQPGTNSRGLLEDLLRGFEQAGHQVFRLELKAYWKLRDCGAAGGAEFITAAFGELVADTVASNGVDLVVGIWDHVVANLPLDVQPDAKAVPMLERLGVPSLLYWWDAPHWFNHGAWLPCVKSGVFAGERQIHHINNPHTAREMRELMNFRNVLVSANAFNPELFKPHPEVRKEFDLVFFSGASGSCRPPSPAMLQELEKPRPDLASVRAEQAQAVKAPLRAFCKKLPANLAAPAFSLLRGLLDLKLADIHAPALESLERLAADGGDAATAALEHLKGSPPLYVEATALVRDVDDWQRAFMVAYLSRRFKVLRLGAVDFSAWGLPGGAPVVPDYADQALHYARGWFGLNVMRWQDDAGLNQKIFEITGCGCGCLQTYRKGLEELYDPDRELLVFDSPAEAREKLADTLASPARRDALAEAGLRRARRDHTWRNRAEKILTFRESLLATG